MGRVGHATAQYQGETGVPTHLAVADLTPGPGQKPCSPMQMARDLRRKCRVACGIFLACSSDSHAQADAMLHATFRNEQTSFFYFTVSRARAHAHALALSLISREYTHSLCDVEVASQCHTSRRFSSTQPLPVGYGQSATGSDHLTSDIPRAGRFQAHERPAHRSRKTNLCVDCCGSCSVRHRAPAWVRQTRPWLGSSAPL